jgi:hypothetical protein
MTSYITQVHPMHVVQLGCNQIEYNHNNDEQEGDEEDSLHHCFFLFGLHPSTFFFIA